MPVVEGCATGGRPRDRVPTARDAPGRSCLRVKRDLELTPGVRVPTGAPRLPVRAVGRGDAVDEPVFFGSTPAVGFEQVRPPRLCKLVGRLARVVVGHAVPPH